MTQTDAKSEAFLQAVYDYGGEATTTQIKQRTGLTQSERNYRFDKLTEYGYIEQSRSHTGHGQRDPPKIAHLTQKGIEFVEIGNLSDEAKSYFLETEWENRFDSLQNEIEQNRREIKEIMNRIEKVEDWRKQISEVFRF